MEVQGYIGETKLIKQPKQSPIPLVFCGALLPTAESSDADTIGTSGRLVVVQNNEEMRECCCIWRLRRGVKNSQLQQFVCTSMLAQLLDRARSVCFAGTFLPLSNGWTL
jgi:hypothetical protein